MFYPYWSLPNLDRTVFTYSETFRALNFVNERINFRISHFSAFLLKNIYISYPETIAANVQTSPNLSIEVRDPAKNRTLSDNPIPIKNYTGPIFGQGVFGGGDIDWLVERSGALYVTVSGQVGGVPANISISLHGLHEVGKI